MRSVEFVYWQVDMVWIGYLRAYPDYWTQGQSLTDLKEHLLDLHHDLTGGKLFEHTVDPE